MKIETKELIDNFMKKLDHSYEYKTSNERVKIEQELINIAESELKLFAIPDVRKRAFKRGYKKGFTEGQVNQSNFDYSRKH